MVDFSGGDDDGEGSAEVHIPSVGHSLASQAKRLVTLTVLLLPFLWVDILSPRRTINSFMGRNIAQVLTTVPQEPQSPFLE